MVSATKPAEQTGRASVHLIERRELSPQCAVVFHALLTREAPYISWWAVWECELAPWEILRGDGLIERRYRRGRDRFLNEAAGRMGMRLAPSDNPAVLRFEALPDDSSN